MQKEITPSKPQNMDKGKEIPHEDETSKFFREIDVTLQIDDFRIDTLALIDSEVNSNFIHEDLIPKNFLQKLKQNLASTSNPNFEYNLSNTLICNHNIYLKTSFNLTKYPNQSVILENPFLNLIKSFYID